jgi:hypothetical protein
MSYEESFPTTITYAEAIGEIEKHNVSPQEFLEEQGIKTNYKSCDLLAWLGY